MNRAELEQLLAPYPDVLTVDEVATVLRIHRRSIQRWAREGRFATIRVGRGYRISRTDVVRWMLESTSKSTNDSLASSSSAIPS